MMLAKAAALRFSDGRPLNSVASKSAKVTWGNNSDAIVDERDARIVPGLPNGCRETPHSERPLCANTGRGCTGWSLSA